MKKLASFLAAIFVLQCFLVAPVHASEGSQPQVFSLEISTSKLQMAVGETARIGAMVHAIGGDALTVTWESSAPSVVTVADGVIEALTEGTAIISATVGEQRRECVVSVMQEKSTHLIETCDTLSNVCEFSDASLFGVGRTDSNYIGDDARIGRRNTLAEYVEYRISSTLAGFSMIAYYHGMNLQEGFHPFTFYISADGADYREITIHYEQQTNLPGTDWLKYAFTPEDSLPEGTYILRIAFPEEYSFSWAPVIGEVDFIAKTAEPAFVVRKGDTDGLENIISQGEILCKQAMEEGGYETGAVEELRYYIDRAKEALLGFDENTDQVLIMTEEKKLEAQIERFLGRKEVNGDTQKLRSVIEQAERLFDEEQYPDNADESLLEAIEQAESVAAGNPTRDNVNQEINKLRTEMANLNAQRDIFGSASSQFETYITRDGDRLMDGTEELRFASFNIGFTLYAGGATWKNYESLQGLRYVDPFEQEDLMKTLVELNAKVARTYVLPIKGTAITQETHLIAAPGVYSEEVFVAFDNLLALANQYGVRLIIPIIDNWSWHGGIEQFCGFYGENAASFYTDLEIIEGFKDYLYDILNRVNSITGVKYKDDKAILCWETGNELNAPSAWVEEIAAFLREEDVNHLVMDGNYGITDSSLSNPDVDIVSNHYYEGSTSTYAERLRSDAVMSKNRKPFVVGEYGLSTNANSRGLIDATIEMGTAGSLLWQLYGRSVDGGFMNNTDLNYPGKNDNDRQLIKYVRQKAYEIDGKEAPDLKAPEAPTLLPIESKLSIAWQGSVGATAYDLERSDSPDGVFEVISADLPEGIGRQYKPAVDNTAEYGKIYYYRIIAKNGAGSSPPSNIVEFAITVKNDLTELLGVIESAEQLHQSADEEEYDHGAKDRLLEAINTAKQIIADESNYTQTQIKAAAVTLSDEMRLFKESRIGAPRTLFYDDFSEGLGKIYQRSSNIILTGSASSAFPEGTGNLVSRNSTENGEVVFLVNRDITGFEITSYFWPYRSSAGILTFAVSTNGQQYQTLQGVVNTMTPGAGDQWNKSVNICETVPSGMRYLKITTKNTGENWNPSINSVRIYGNAPADKQEMEALVQQALALNEKDYTPESWAGLAVALGDAQTVLEDDGATSEQVEQAVERLQTAMDGLVERLLFYDDFSEGLGKIYLRSSNIILAGSASSAFPEGTGNLVRRNSTEDGEIVYLVDEDITGFEITSYFWPYRSSVGMLTFAVSADGQQYQTLQGVVNTMTPGAGDQWNKSVNICELVQLGMRYLKVTIKNTGENWNPQINSVRILLEKPAPVDKQELETLVQQAFSLNKEDYTLEPWDGFAIALEDAQIVLEDDDATSEQVQQIIERLQTVMDGLEEAADELTLVSAATNEK